MLKYHDVTQAASVSPDNKKLFAVIDINGPKFCLSLDAEVTYTT